MCPTRAECRHLTRRLWERPSGLCAELVAAKLPVQHLGLGGRMLVMELLQAPQQCLQVLPRGCRQGDGLPAQVSLQPRQIGSGSREIDLIGDDGMGPLSQAC